MSESLRKRIEATPLVQALADLARSTKPGDVSVLTGVTGSLTGLLCSALQDSLHSQIVVILPEKEQALHVADDVTLAAGEDGIRLFLGREEHEAVLSERSRETNDVHTLRLLTAGDVRILVTHAAGLAARLPLPSLVQRDAVTLAAGASAGFDDTLRKLRQFHFERADIVEHPGEYALRGGIIDVFPFVGENPLRIEYFGDTIESLREFDVSSQRSIRALDAAVIVPDLMAETDGSDDSRGDTTLVEYLADAAILVMVEPLSCAEVWRHLAESGRPDVVSPERIEEVLSLFPRLALNTLAAGPVHLDVGARHQPSLNGSVQMLVRELADRQASGYHTLLTCETAPERERLRDLIGVAIAALDESARPDQESIEFLLEPIHEGFILPSLHLAVYAEHQIFGRVKGSRKRRTVRFKGITESEMHQLRKGDYVVHEDFGIGRFAGLKTIQVRDVHMEVAAVLISN